MARIRTIKPELWTDPEFVECSPNARLLFVAALNFASDYGVMADKPVQLKMQCFPGDDLSVGPLIEELIDHGFWVRRIAPDGAHVLVIRTFLSHQRVDKPQKGRWGDPTEWHEFVEPSTTIPRTIVEPSSTEGNGRDGNGVEGKGTPSAGKAAAVALHAMTFEEFYNRYPHKKSKGSAGTAYLKALRIAPHEDIMAGLERNMADLVEAKSRNYCPYPASWLNAQAWNDEPSGVTRRPDTTAGNRASARQRLKELAEQDEHPAFGELGLAQ